MGLLISYMFRFAFMILLYWFLYQWSDGSMMMFCDGYIFYGLLIGTLISPFMAFGLRAISQWNTAQNYKRLRYSMYMIAMLFFISPFIMILAYKSGIRDEMFSIKLGCSLLVFVHALALDIIWLHPTYLRIEHRESLAAKSKPPTS